MSKYEYKNYGTARFQIEGGMYSIQELEDLLDKLKAAKRLQDSALKDTMRSTNTSDVARESAIRARSNK